MNKHWTQLLNQHKEKLKEIYDQLRQEKENDYVICPKPSNIFKALKLTSFDDVKVVILGQDVYYTPKTATGLAFASNTLPLPPSLKNIILEIRNDTGDFSANPNLESWAKQGVLLLNSHLTCRQGKALSHAHFGWQEITDAIISDISNNKQHVVFIFWGKEAQKKKILTDPNSHLILEAAHPSPLAAYHGFFGCKHFSITNEYLKLHGKEPIIW